LNEIQLRSTEEIREGQLQKEPDLRASWERTALARAVALSVVGYRIEHHLTQTKLAEILGVRQPQAARLELGEHTPSLEMLRRIARALGLRFIIEVAPADGAASRRALALPVDVAVVGDVTVDGARVLIAAGSA
jgi:DNA-binding XRE family transcriptional regulator